MADDLTQEQQITKLTDDNTKLQTALETLPALQESVSNLEANNRLLLQEKGEIEKSAKLAAHSAAKKTGSMDDLDNSWKEKLAIEVEAKDATIAERDSTISEQGALINKITSGRSALEMAVELATEGNYEAVLPHISKRLAVEIVDGEAREYVLDSNGKRSASTKEELRTEIEALKFLAPVLKGSRASGSGDIGDKGKAQGKTITRSDFDNKTVSEQNTLLNDGVVPVD